MRRIALARMFLRGTKPNTRESLEKLRLSPITKYSPAGMVTGCGVEVAIPVDVQQYLSVVHACGRYGSFSIWNGPFPSGLMSTSVGL